MNTLFMFMFTLFMCSEAITKPLERRGLSLDQVHVFIQSSKTALPLQSDCSLLAGSVLKVRGSNNYISSFYSSASIIMI